MIKTTGMLLDELKDYGNPKTRLGRMVKNGICYPVVRGLYETEKSISPYLLAGSISGPSYISFEFALSRYSLIPERVCSVTSATCGKRKKKIFRTQFGDYSYQDVPAAVFPFETEIVREGDYYYRIATPEKALCDQLYSIRHMTINNLKDMEYLLFDDLRIADEELLNFNLETVCKLAELYGSTTVKKFSVFLRRFLK